jgi:hypothetical protein
MKKILVVMVGLVMAFSSWARADFIVKPVRAMASSEMSGAINAITGPQMVWGESQGLTFDLVTGDAVPASKWAYPTHGVYQPAQWVSSDEVFGSGKWIEFDLGAAYKVTSFHVWNYNNWSAGGRASKNVTVQYLNNGSWVNVESMTFLQGGNGDMNYYGETYGLATPITAQNIRFLVTNNYGGENYAGLSEVRFITSMPLPPTFTPAGNSITSPTTVTISGPAGAAIYYTTDGTTPTTSSTNYTVPLLINPGTMLKAISVVGGNNVSVVTSQRYSRPLEVLINDNFPQNGNGGVTVDSNVWNTLNPSWFQWNSGLQIYKDAPEELDQWSGVISKQGYRLGVDKLILTSTIDRQNTTSGGDIYFGLMQSATGISKYDIVCCFTRWAQDMRLLSYDPQWGDWCRLWMSGDEGLSAIQGGTMQVSLEIDSTSYAFYSSDFWDQDSDGDTSEMVLRKSGTHNLGSAVVHVGGLVQQTSWSGAWHRFYSIKAEGLHEPSPTFTPSGPYITGPTAVAISGATGNTGIYYTTNGSIPTTSSACYSVPLLINPGTTLKAIVARVGYPQSEVTTQTYMYPPASTPTFTPGGRRINGPTSVTISSATAGASIYYTLDGSEPTTSNIAYSNPATVMVTGGQTLKAIACGNQHSSSGVASVKYVVSVPILAWSGILSHLSNPERFNELAEAGFTHQYQFYTNSDLVQTALDNAHVAGIKLITCLNTVPSSQFIQTFKNHPALEAYFVSDEPGTTMFSTLASQIQTIRSQDPNHWCYVNLLPTYAFPSINSYKSYVNSYMSTVPVQVLSFDHYPIMDTGVRPDFYENLEIISTAAKNANVPFWAFALSTSHASYPVPTLTHLRFQVFSNLAYGAQGIQYFTYWTPGEDDFHDGPIQTNGLRTETYYTVQSMNQEIIGLSPVFLGARVDRVRHTGSIPSGTTAYTPVAPVQSLTASGSDGAVVSELTNGDNHYIVIVNRDINNMMTLDLTVDTSKSFSRVAKDGSVTGLTGGTMSFTVDPADIVVLKWGNAVTTIPGDANRDGSVDVGDLGILAANYGGSGKSWSQGDFNGDGLVDVGDLGILAAHYGTNASSADWSADYAKAFGTTADDADDVEETSSSICSGLGLPLIAGLVLMGLMLVKLEE